MPFNELIHPQFKLVLFFQSFRTVQQYYQQLQQNRMSEIKEINALGTIASIRKATQDSLKPIIQEIERKMVAMNKQTMQLASKTQKILQLQKRQNRSEQGIRYLQSQLIEMKEHCQSIQWQQTADKQTRERIEQTLREDFRKLRKEKEKQDIIIESMKDQNERISKQLNSALQSMKARQDVLEKRFKELTQQTKNLSYEVKSGAEKMSAQFDEIKNTLNHELKSNIRRLELLDMYEAEKDYINKKIKGLTRQLETTVKQQEFEFYKECVTKQQQRVINSVKKIIDDNLSQKTRELLLLLPQMREEILYCLDYEKKINKINEKIKQILDLIAANKLQGETNYNRFKTNVFDRFLAVEQERIQMTKNINKALGFQHSMIQKLDEYSDRLKDELREQNYRKSRELFEQIKISFADKKQQIRQRELQKIIQERQKLFDRSIQMQNLANKIGQILTNFSTRITKIKSDNELFVQKVKKQLLAIDVIRKALNNNTSLIGQTLSQIIQSILITTCIQIEKQSKNDEQIAFSTHDDGVIYQKYIHHKQSDVGNLMYRRKVMNAKILKRALIAALTHVYDKLMDEENCLCWNEHSPSLYFKDHIDPIYQNLIQKVVDAEQSDRMFKTSRMYDNDALTIRPRDTILSSFENNQSNNRKPATTHRSRKTRYDDTGIFLAKSARRVRGSINTTIVFD